MVQNKGLVLKAIPEGVPVVGKDLVVEAKDFDLDQSPPEGGATIKNIYASFDPYMRGRMRDPSIKSYSPAFPVGSVITSWSVAQVLKSNTSKFQPGDIIKGSFPIEQYSVIQKAQCQMTGCQKLPNPYNLDPKLFIGPMGMPGLTAYSSLYEIGKPQNGETIFISAASGAVGQIVGQLAKHDGLRVIGSVGSDEKLDFITKELKFDGGFNYKKEKAADALKRLAPEGIEIYYENVGGEQLEAALNALKEHGRVVTCGMISQYSLKPGEQYPIRNLMQVVAKRLLIRGFIVGDPDMGPKYEKEQHERMGKLISEGSMIVKTSVTDGIDNAPEGFLGMLQGKNFGKAVLKIANL